MLTLQVKQELYVRSISDTHLSNTFLSSEYIFKVNINQVLFDCIFSLICLRSINISTISNV